MHKYAIHHEYPAFLEASAYGGIALINDSQSHDNWAILLLIMRASCSGMGGWLDRESI